MLAKQRIFRRAERKIALHVFAQLGFNVLMHLPDYVLDMKAVPHDYVLLGKNLKVEEMRRVRGLTGFGARVEYPRANLRIRLRQMRTAV